MRRKESVRQLIIPILRIDRLPASSFFSRTEYCITVDESTSITYKGGTQVPTDRGGIPIEDLKVTDKIVGFIKS